MSGFSIRNPYFIVVVCVLAAVLGVVALVQMPVDMFPPIRLPVVAVATFFSGMPPQQVESDITFHLERQFTLGSGIDHIESRSLPGVSLIKVFFHPGVDPDAAAAMISTLAMSDLKDMPPGTYPPIVLKTDPANLPVCLVTLEGAGMNDGRLKDLAQNFVRNQLAGVAGASVPQPFGGRWRQITLYTDPEKLEANQLSPMDLVRAVNDANIILPAGDARIGPYDYPIYTNALLGGPADIGQVPLKMDGQSPLRVQDVATPSDDYSLQYNRVLVNGERSVYLPIFKQGGEANTIAIVDGVRQTLRKLYDVPRELKTAVVFDQSRFVKTAIDTLLHEGGIGLFLTCLMILIFLGSLRATVAVFFSIPLSVLATFVVLHWTGNSVNSMILAGLALALSRLIDNSVVVLENIYRHLELGEPPHVAAETGGSEVALPVLAATLTTAVVFFPVTLLYGVSRFLFSALALAVVISLFASFFVAMTVVPLFCARWISAPHGGSGPHAPEARRLGLGARFHRAFNAGFESMLHGYDRCVGWTLGWPRATLAAGAALFVATLGIFPLLGVSFFPRTDAGQFMINVKAPSGSNLDASEREIHRLEALVRDVVSPGDLDMIVSNIGVNPGFSALFSPNSAMHTAFVQVSLKPGHKIGSYEYIERVRQRMRGEMPELTAFFSSGSLVDGVVNMGLPAPIDVQIAGTDLNGDFAIAQNLMAQIRRVPGVADVYMPQDLDDPSLRLTIDRTRALEMGLTEKEVVSNVITALTSNTMIAPSIWIDPKNGNNYFLVAQYPASRIQSIDDLRAIPLHRPGGASPTRLDMVATVQRFNTPTELDHNQIRRQLDIYIRPQGEDLGRIARQVSAIVARTKTPFGIDIAIAGSVNAMNASFRSFAIGLGLAVVLLYLILVAQFRSLLDPWIILLALPPGLSGTLLTLWLTGTTLNVMSLMGVIMLVGIVLSNSILIVEFAHRLIGEGADLRGGIAAACRVRLRPILMTSLATVIGLLPMAMKLGEGSEAYAPLARALIGGLLLSVALTIFLVPAGFVLAYGRRRPGLGGLDATQAVR